MSVLDPASIIQSFGLIGIGVMVFAESGLLIGFFLPGDTLLFSAGFFAAQGRLPLGWLLVVLIVSAIAGYEVGYEIGKRAGKRVFKKEDGIFFRQEYIEQAENFYERHGGKTVVLARFIPIVRTFTSVVAGVGSMPRQKYSLYNIAGAIPWCVGVTMLGYWLGQKVPNVDKYLLPAVLLATAFTFAPTIYHILHDKETRSRIAVKLLAPFKKK